MLYVFCTMLSSSLHRFTRRVTSGAVHLCTYLTFNMFILSVILKNVVLSCKNLWFCEMFWLKSVFLLINDTWFDVHVSNAKTFRHFWSHFYTQAGLSWNVLLRKAAKEFKVWYSPPRKIIMHFPHTKRRLSKRVCNWNDALRLNIAFEGHLKRCDVFSWFSNAWNHPPNLDSMKWRLANGNISVH